MNDKPNYYGIIPAEVRYSTNVSSGAKLLYCEITALTNSTGECWASNGYFAKLYSKSNDTISRWVSELEKAGFITVVVEKVDGTSRYISIVKDAVNLPGGLGKNAAPVRQKRQTGLGKNAEYNITLNNTNNKEETPPSQSKAKKVKAVTISKMETVEAEAMPEIHSEFIWRLKHTNEPERKAKLEQHVISELKTKLPERLGRLGYHYTAEQLDAFINDQVVKKGIDAAKTQFFQNGDIGKCDTVEHIINSALYQIKNNGALNIPETVKQKAAAKQVKHNHPFFDL